MEFSAVIEVWVVIIKDHFCLFPDQVFA